MSVLNVYDSRRKSNNPFYFGVFNLIISRTAIFLRFCSHPVEYFNYTTQFEKNLFPIINKRILFRYKGVPLY